MYAPALPSSGTQPSAADPRRPQPPQQQPAKQTRQLTPAEEARLARAAAAGDTRAAALLAHANRGLVHFLAARFAGRGLETQDLVAEGMLALERAAARYDPTREASFGTFAAAAISNRMSRAVRTQGRAVRLPGHHYRDMARARRAMADLAQRLGRQPGCEELAQECGFSVTHTWHLLRAMAPARQSSLEAGGGAGAQGEAEAVEIDELESEGEQEDASALETELQQKEQLALWLSQLDARKAEVVALRHGIRDGRLHSFKEIGERLGCTGAWAAEQYKRATLKLQRQAELPAGGSPSLLAAVASLSPEARLAMALRHGWLGPKLTYRQIGLRMGASTTWATSACKQAEASLRAALPASEPLSAAVLEGVQLSLHQRGALLRVMSELGAAQGPPAAAAASPHGPSACLEDSLPEGLEVFTRRSSDGTAPVHAIDLDHEWREELAAHERRAAARASGRP